MIGGNGFCVYYNSLLMSNCCRIWGYIFVVFIVKVYGFYSGREVELFWFFICFVGEEIVFMVIF